MKRTIIEILTAEIKLYEDGHQYVMDALQDYKVIVTLHQKHPNFSEIPRNLHFSSLVSSTQNKFCV